MGWSSCEPSSRKCTCILFLCDDSLETWIFQVVNFGSNSVNLQISINGLGVNPLQSSGSTKTELTSGNVMDENSFQAPNKVCSTELLLCSFVFLKRECWRCALFVCRWRLSQRSWRTRAKKWMSRFLPALWHRLTCYSTRILTTLWDLILLIKNLHTKNMIWFLMNVINLNKSSGKLMCALFPIHFNLAYMFYTRTTVIIIDACRLCPIC